MSHGTNGHRAPLRSPLAAPTILAAGLLLAVGAATALAQDRPEDRRRYVAPGTPVSDDPRRVPVAPGPTGPDGSIVLVGGRIFDGTGAAARPGTLVIERNRIRAVLAPGSKTWPAEARVIDVGGMTVLPGLIDLHTHLSYYMSGGFGPADEPQQLIADPIQGTLRGVERLRAYIASGITSVRDVGSHGDVAFRLKDWVRARRLPGPRVFAAGNLISARGGHAAGGLRPGSLLFGAVRVASGPEEWREAVREQYERGADFIKLTSHFTREEVAAAIAEAHALGLRVTVDAETFYTQWAVEAGADCIEHPLPRSEETIRLMATKGTCSVPTVVSYKYIFDTRGGYYGTMSRRFSFSHEANIEMVRKMKRAGVTIGVGTDLVGAWYRHLPAAYLTELKVLVAAGFTGPEALVAATGTNATIIDMADRLGTLEPGKLADVLVVRGKPDELLDDLTQVQWVIRDGEVVVDRGQIVGLQHLPLPEPGTAPARRSP
ncbi:MAG: amidohydrolase family protein [Gemmatimonadetes bacterium]|nr:amidohydrolase family protein [Gemmatimonadota bacterium]